MSVYQFVGRDGFVSWWEASGAPTHAVRVHHDFPPEWGRPRHEHPSVGPRVFHRVELRDSLGFRSAYAEGEWASLSADKLALGAVETVLRTLVGLEVLLRSIVPHGVEFDALADVRKALAVLGWPVPTR